MKQKQWDCTVAGTAPGGVWSWEGSCTAPDETRAQAMAKTLAFQALVGSRANPSTCGGPYQITKLEVKERST